MLLKYFYDDDLAQASYLIACPATGDALVIDPARNIEPYLQLAQERGFRIIGAAETHIHADFVSGGRELAIATAGKLFVSAYGAEMGYRIDPDETGTFEVCLLHEGDTIQIGNLTLQVLHTPGHTPEHLCYLLTDTGMTQPFALFSGDCLFAGDMGRPDLLEIAVGIVGSKETGAKQQFASMQRLKAMPDYLQVLPGHGAGSACGKALGDVPSTTLGYEKLFNPAFQFTEEAPFVEWLLSGQPPVPRYFAQMKQVNQRGAVSVNTLKWPRPVVYDSELKLAREYLMIDTRPVQVFAAGHIPASINVPASDSKFSTYVGMYVDYEKPVYLVVDSQDLEVMVDRLRAIGVDQIGGYVAPRIAGNYHFTTPVYSPEETAEARAEGATILDVRNLEERKASYIAGTLFIPMDEIPYRMAELPRTGQIIIHCASGVRSSLVASLLQKHGYTNVAHLIGGLDAWKTAGLPIETGL